MDNNNNNNNNNKQRRTDSLLMRLKKFFFGETVIRYNLSSQTCSTLDHTRFSTPPPPASTFEEEDVVGQQVEEAALDAGSVFTSKKKKFRVRKSRHAGRTVSVAEDNLQSRLLFQDMKIKDMEEERENMMILIEMMRTKISAMEKDKEMRKFMSVYKM